MDLNRGLKAHYSFSGNANDVSGNGLHGAIQGNPKLTTDRFGNANSAYQFDGIKDAIIITDKGKLSTPAFSIVYFFSTESTALQVCVGKINYENGNAATFNSGVDQSGTSAFFGTMGSINNCNVRVPTTYVHTIYSNPTAKITQWHCVVNTFENGVESLYLDGILAKQKTLTFNNATYCDNTNLTIGTWWKDDQRRFKGKLDEVRYYDRVINIEEVKSLCLAGNSTKIGCDNWLKTPYQESWVGVGDLDIPGDQLTVEAIYNRTIPMPGEPFWDADLVSKHLRFDDVNYLLRAGHAEITTTKGFFSTPEVCMIDFERTYHVAMVYDGKKLKFYRNGFLMSEAPVTGNMAQNDWETRIGYLGFSGNIENFIGYINEVKIWKVARTQEEIRAYMDKTLPNPSSQNGLMAYYSFDNLLNKQGDIKWNGRLGGGASIKNLNPNCEFIADSCIIKQSISNIINDYTPITDLNTCNNTVAVENAFAFNPGDTVLLIQMKGAVIDSTNTATFGSITDYSNAGNYEFNIVKQKTANTITLINTIERQYNIPDGKVQLIRVPYYKNAEINAGLTCLPWDGSKGGVLVFNIKEDAILKADIDVSGKGFRHGLPLNSSLEAMNEQLYFYNASSNKGAQKGESIYSMTDTKNYGRGANSNGGGGGNARNSGGGGGGNGGKGGQGGDQWATVKNITENVGGKGGSNLFTNSGLKKLFLGGSGGMGHGNNEREFPAGNGGGIIIFSATSIQTNGYTIKANGHNAMEAPNSDECKDGMAGGGAGGSIFMDIKNIVNPLKAEAMGGKGADHIANNVLHGPGGGGGGGIIVITQLTTPILYSFKISGGVNGVNTYHANNPWGATPGQPGMIVNNFKPVIANNQFRKNIDSLKSEESRVTCMGFNFTGLAYIRLTPISAWQWSFGDGQKSNFQNPEHSYATTGNYQVKLVATDQNGCKDSIIKPITVQNLEISKSRDTAICENSSVNLFAGGGTIYSWLPATGLSDPNSSNPVATPLSPTKYYVTVSNSLGCSKIDSVSIGLNNLPDITTSNDTTICFKTVAPLFAGGGVSYNWSPGTGLNNSTIPNPVASPVATTIYTVNVTNAEGCSKEQTVQINVNPVPTITKSNDTLVCKNVPLQLFVSGGNSYVWSPTTNIDNSTSSTPIVSPSATTTYYVAIADALSCMYKDSVKVAVRESAIFTISPNNSVCLNTPHELTASGGTSYSWNPAINLNNPAIANPVATVNTSTTYTVLIKEDNCNESATLSTTLTPLPLPDVKAFKSNDVTCSFPSSNLSASGAQSYSWTPVNGLNNSTISNPTATPSVTTTYVVTGKDANGCTNTDEITIQKAPFADVIYELPNSFTPNGDGLNDCFGVSKWGVMQDLELSVYNRLGQKVFYTNDASRCWDGNLKGQPQNSGIFVYTVKAKTACGLINKKGTILLLR